MTQENQNRKETEKHFAPVVKTLAEHDQNNEKLCTTPHTADWRCIDCKDRPFKIKGGRYKAGKAKSINKDQDNWEDEEVSFACIHRENQHEVGCEHRKWTVEELRNALITKKKFEFWKAKQDIDTINKAVGAEREKAEYEYKNKRYWLLKKVIKETLEKRNKEIIELLKDWVLTHPDVFHGEPTKHWWFIQNFLGSKEIISFEELKKIESNFLNRAKK